MAVVKKHQKGVSLFGDCARQKWHLKGSKLKSQIELFPKKNPRHGKWRGILILRNLFFVVFFNLFKIRINNVFLGGCTAGLVRRPSGGMCLLLVC